MKKLGCLFLTLILLLSSCGSDSSTNSSVSSPPPSSTTQESNSSSSSIADPPPKSDLSSEEISATSVTISPTVVFDKGGIKITATGLSFDSSFYGPSIMFLVENNTEFNIIVQCDSFSANGYMLPFMMSIDVAAGKKANDDLSINVDYMNASGVGVLTDFLFSLEIMDENFIYIDTAENIVLKTSAFDLHQQEYDTTGKPLYYGNDVKIVAKGLTYDDGDASIWLYLENRTDKHICVQADNVSVNGYMVSSIFSCDILPGMRAVDDISIRSSTLAENGIDRIDEIELIFQVFDYTVFDTMFETNPVALSFTYD